MSYRANSKKKEMAGNDLHVSANLLGNNERHMEKQFKKTSLLGFDWNSIFKVIFLVYVRTVVKQLIKNLKVFKDLKISCVSGFSFLAIEPIGKDGNDGIFRKPRLSGKLMKRVLFSWV